MVVKQVKNIKPGTVVNFKYTNFASGLISGIARILNVSNPEDLEDWNGGRQTTTIREHRLVGGHWTVSESKVNTITPNAIAVLYQRGCNTYTDVIDGNMWVVTYE